MTRPISTERTNSQVVDCTTQYLKASLVDDRLTYNCTY